MPPTNSLDVVRFANERVDPVRDRVQRVFEQVVDQFGFTRVVPVQIPYRNIGPLGDRRYRTAEYPVLADDLDRSVADPFDFGPVHFFAIMNECSLLRMQISEQLFGIATGNVFFRFLSTDYS